MDPDGTSPQIYEETPHGSSLEIHEVPFPFYDIHAGQMVNQSKEPMNCSLIRNVEMNGECLFMLYDKHIWRYHIRSKSIDKFPFSQNSRHSAETESKTLFWIESKQLLVVYARPSVGSKDPKYHFDFYHFENSELTIIHSDELVSKFDLEYLFVGNQSVNVTSEWAFWISITYLPRVCSSYVILYSISDPGQVRLVKLPDWISWMTISSQTMYFRNRQYLKQKWCEKIHTVSLSTLYMDGYKWESQTNFVEIESLKEEFTICGGICCTDSYFLIVRSENTGPKVLPSTPPQIDVYLKFDQVDGVKFCKSILLNNIDLRVFKIDKVVHTFGDNFIVYCAHRELGHLPGYECIFIDLSNTDQFTTMSHIQQVCLSSNCELIVHQKAKKDEVFPKLFRISSLKTLWTEHACNPSVFSLTNDVQMNFE